MSLEIWIYQKVRMLVIAMWLLSICIPFSAEASETGEKLYKNHITTNSSDSISKESITSECVYSHGSIKIQVSQVKKAKSEFKSSSVGPRWCRASVEIIKGNDVIERIYHNDIRPVGHYYGVFVPKVQPSSKYFLLVKLGDYDGRLYLIDNQGSVTDLPGGLYFITQDRRYLFSQYLRDESTFLVFDLQLGKTVYISSGIPSIHQWYKKNERYFFTVSKWTDGSSLPTENSEIVYVYNPDSHKLFKKKGTTWLKDASKQIFDFDPKTYRDCDCRR